MTNNREQKLNAIAAAATAYQEYSGVDTIVDLAAIERACDAFNGAMAEQASGQPVDIKALEENLESMRQTNAVLVKRLQERESVAHWQDCKEVMPKAKTLYFITDGDTWALAQWNIENMWWDFKFHTSVFKATHFMEVKIPKPPEITCSGE